MPTFSNISNGESGLSVRNTLNQVIDYVNTGITTTDYYVTGGTYNNGTGTLTLNRQNGSVNVTGFLTGVTETQNLTNVLAIGNTTSGRNIVVTDGDKIVGSNLTLSGGTSFNVDTQTGNIQGTIDIVPTGTSQSVHLKTRNVSNNLTGELKIGTDSMALRQTKSSDYTELFITPLGGNGIYQNAQGNDFVGFVGLNDGTYNSGIHSENSTTGEVSRISMTPTNMFKEVTDNTGYTYVDMYYNSLDITSSDGGTNSSNFTFYPTSLNLSSSNGTRNNSIAIDGSVGNIELVSQDGVDYQSSIVTSTDFGSYIQLTSENFTTGEINSHYLSPTEISLSSTDGSSTSTQTINPTINSIVSSDISNTGSTSTSKSSVVILQTDGSNTGQINVTSSSSSVENMDGTGNYANIVFSPTDATIQSSDGVTNTGTILVESNGNITSTSTDGTNIGSIYSVPTSAGMQYTDGTINVTSEVGTNIGGAFTKLMVNDGITNVNELELTTTDITISSTDGTTTSTQTIVPTEILAEITDGTNTNSSSSQKDLDIHSVTDGTYTSTIQLQGTDGRISSNEGTNSAEVLVESNGNITSTSTDGTNTSTQILENDSFGLNITTNTNNSFAQVDISKTQFYTEISNGTGYTNIDMYDYQMGLYADDGITNLSIIELQPTSITSTVTDGTITSGLDLDPSVSNNGTRFYSDSPSISSSTGILLAPDQSYQWGGDYNYSQTAYTENFISGTQQYLFQQYGDYISQLVLDPASLNTGTLFKSEDLVVGSSSILSLGYDGQGSFDMVDGTGSGSNFTFTPISLNLSSSNGSSTSTILVEPTSITTNLSDIGDYKVNGNSYDGTNTGSTEFGIYNGYGWGVYVADNGGNGVTSIDIPYDNSTADILFYPVTGKIKFDSGMNDLLLECPNIPSYDDDTAASGLTTGQIYQTTGLGASPLNVAGILMVKQ